MLNSTFDAASVKDDKFKTGIANALSWVNRHFKQSPVAPDLGNEDDQSFLIHSLSDVGIGPTLRKHFEQASLYSQDAIMLHDAYRTDQPYKPNFWRAHGIPEQSAPKLRDHISAMVVMAELGMTSPFNKANNKGIAGAFRMAPFYLREMIKIVGVSEAMAPLEVLVPASNDASRIKRLGIGMIVAGMPRQDEMMGLWDEYDAQETPASHYAHDIGVLVDIMEAEAFKTKYPESMDDLIRAQSILTGRLETEEARNVRQAIADNPSIIQLFTSDKTKSHLDLRKDPLLDYRYS